MEILALWLCTLKSGRNYVKYYLVNCEGFILFSLLKGNKASVCILIPKPSLKNTNCTNNQLAGDGNKGVQLFPKDINLQVNEKSQLEFELDHFKIAAKHFSHYAAIIPTE